MRRRRRVKIVATLGPASRAPHLIHRLCEAGVDVFRINMSHTDHATLADHVEAIREVSAPWRGPLGFSLICRDRSSALAHWRVVRSRSKRVLWCGSPSTRDGDATCLCLPHREVFAVLKPGSPLLVDDGRVRLRITEAGPESAVACRTRRAPDGSEGCECPWRGAAACALSAKDRADLDRALELQVDWIALSFVQRPEDVAAARQIVAGRAGVLAKREARGHRPA